MGQRIRSHNWAATALGPIEAWPQSLKTAVGIMLTTRHPVFIFWGSELVCLYNDAYAASLGPEKHPSILGQPAVEAWPEAYPVVEPELKQVMAGGEATWQENTLVPIRRKGRIEEVYWTYSYGPIHDADAPNGVGGVLALITETTRTVVSKREAEARYRMLFEALDQGFCVVDMVFDEQNRPVDYVFVEINPAFEAQTGLHHAAGKSMRALRPELEDHWFEIYGRIALTGVSERFEHKAAALGRWYNVFASRVGDPESRRVAILFDDITERKRAEEALRESEARFRLMADAVPQIVWITDSDGNTEFFNRHWSDYTGVPYEPTTAARVATDFVHPEDGAATMAAFENARRTGGVFQVEHRIRSSSGDYRWFLVRAEPYRDPRTGEVIRWIGASVDIHDRRLAEAKLRESEARFRHMADSAPALIWMSDEEGRVTFANMHYEYMFERPVAEMLGEGWAQIVLPEDLERHTKAFFDAFQARAAFHCETRVLDKDGQVRWLRCEGVPRFDDARRFLGYTGCNVDITESKVAEEHQNLLINELNHRVKNTLATVQSITSQTLRNTETAAQAKGAIEGRLFALSRAHDVLTRENWEGADLYEIVEQAVAPYSSRGEDRLHLAGPKVRLSPRTALSLAMMLQELATNAVKYGALSNEAGEIRITWDVDLAEPSQLRLRWEESGGPAVQAPTRRGFGTRLIERSLAQDLGGQVDIAFAPTGVVCTVDAPLA
jgi:PAS domain S-box-containing protein